MIILRIFFKSTLPLTELLTLKALRLYNLNKLMKKVLTEFNYRQNKH